MAPSLQRRASRVARHLAAGAPADVARHARDGDDHAFELAAVVGFGHEALLAAQLVEFGLERVPLSDQQRDARVSRRGRRIGVEEQPAREQAIVTRLGEIAAGAIARVVEQRRSTESWPRCW